MKRIAISLAAVGLLTTAANAQQPPKPATIPAARIQTKPGSAPGAGADIKPVTAKLDIALRGIDLDVLRKSFLGYRPGGVSLTATKPAAIVTEPAYRGKPLYGAIRLGNGPQSLTYFAIDEVKGEKGRIYVDFNQNGDLTDDGSPEWTKTTDEQGLPYYEREVTLHASWGDAVTETEGASYLLLLYRRGGDTRVNYVRYSGRSGKFAFADKTYPGILVENSNDAIFTVPKSGDRTRGPVTLLLDLDGDGTYKGTKTGREQFSLDQPFQIDGKWYEAFPNISGSELTIVSSQAPGTPAGPARAAVPRPTLLKVGEKAPDFTAQSPDGKSVRLSDFKGKTVILDFWATWCGPCQASMPGLEKIYGQIKDQNVVVLSVNVFDAKDPFDAWIAKNSGTKYSFTFAFDPAGHDQAKSIAASKYGVSGIPTLFVIGKDGKIASAIVGSGNEKNIVSALDKLGVKAVAE